MGQPDVHTTNDANTEGSMVRPHRSPKLRVLRCQPPCSRAIDRHSKLEDNLVSRGVREHGAQIVLVHINRARNLQNTATDVRSVAYIGLEDSQLLQRIANHDVGPSPLLPIALGILRSPVASCSRSAALK